MSLPEALLRCQVWYRHCTHDTYNTLCMGQPIKAVAKQLTKEFQNPQKFQLLEFCAILQRHVSGRVCFCKDPYRNDEAENHPETVKSIKYLIGLSKNNKTIGLANIIIYLVLL